MYTTIRADVGPSYRGFEGIFTLLLAHIGCSPCSARYQKRGAHLRVAETFPDSIPSQIEVILIRPPQADCLKSIVFISDNRYQTTIVFGSIGDYYIIISQFTCRIFFAEIIFIGIIPKIPPIRIQRIVIVCHFYGFSLSGSRSDFLDLPQNNFDRVRHGHKPAVHWHNHNG